MWNDLLIISAMHVTSHITFQRMVNHVSRGLIWSRTCKNTSCLFLIWNKRGSVIQSTGVWYTLISHSVFIHKYVQWGEKYRIYHGLPIKTEKFHKWQILTCFPSLSEGNGWISATSGTFSVFISNTMLDSISHMNK